MGTGSQEITMQTTDLESLRVAKVVDARWAPCPGPLLETKKSIGPLREGDVIEIRTLDPGARGDIAAWAGKAGHEFIGFLAWEGYERIFLRKRAG